MKKSLYNEKAYCIGKNCIEKSKENIWEWIKQPLKKGSGFMVPKHVAFAPASQSNSDQGFALLSFGEEPCPLSLSHGFFTIQPSPSESEKSEEGMA